MNFIFYDYGMMMIIICSYVAMLRALRSLPESGNKIYLNHTRLLARQ